MHFVWDVHRKLEKFVWLIENHLLLSYLGQQRDFSFYLIGWNPSNVIVTNQTAITFTNWNNI